jgi:tyrosyl-tRNA synthetase
MQDAGHEIIFVIGDFTGMIGDPSGKSQERNLLDLETLRKNQEGIKKQLAKFLDFEDDLPNSAMMVNNYDWMCKYSFLDFIRDIGKHLTVNYMMAKDSVKKRLSGEGEGMSFTEFTYQLVQGYDFLHLYQTLGCKLQMGGSDQWGNITTGTELIRRKTGGEAFALVCPLITKADGGKFGKTEQGNIWLDPEKTSPYQFYQFWLNCSDEDSKKYIRIFTLLRCEEIEILEKEHETAPQLRVLQKALAKDLTCRVHSEEDFEAAVAASEILFGKGTAETLAALPEKTFLSVFEGVPQVEISYSIIADGINVVDFLTDITQIFPSKSEARRTLKENGVSINKARVSDNYVVSASSVLNGKYILVQRGKKNYYIVVLQ